jgi:16S rRNA pseudouridine516 synthase
MKSRLDKILAGNGFGSRRDIKRILREGTLLVNGCVCRDPSIQVDSEADELVLDGAPLSIRSSVYLMLNKCAGVITSTDDPEHRTVIDLLDEPYSRMELFPIGRLDLDTEGLLVITNDGPLTHRLTSPKTGVDKTYFARLRDPVDDAMFADYAARFHAGVSFHDGYTCQPAFLVRSEDGFLLTIQEGKYHQVKKMFKVVGNEVVYLKRVSMGSLALDPSLSPGEYRELTGEEIAALRADVGQGG